MDANIKEQANTQRGLYKVTDHFFGFWYAFVFPNLSELESGDAEGIYQYVVKPELERFTSMYLKRFASNICVSRTENMTCHFILRRLAVGGTRLMK